MHARDVAGAAFGGLEGLLQQRREALEPLIEIADLAVDLVDDRVERLAPVRHHLVGAAVAGVDLLGRRRQRAALRLELVRGRRDVAQHRSGAGEERLHLLLEARAHRAAAFADVVHRGDELADAAGQRRLDRAEILRRAAEHFLQQHVRLAQPLEQRGGVVAQHAVRFHHLGHGGGCGLLRALDRAARGRVEIGDRAVDRRGRLRARIVDDLGDLLAVLQHRLGEGHALRLDRLHRRVGDALDLGRELLALRAEGAQEHAGLLVEHALEVGAALVDVRGQFLGLGGDAARDLGADAEQRALDLAGVLLQRGGHARSRPWSASARPRRCRA